MDVEILNIHLDSYYDDPCEILEIFSKNWPSYAIIKFVIFGKVDIIGHLLSRG